MPPLTLTWARADRIGHRWAAEGCAYVCAKNDGKTWRVMLRKASGDLVTLPGRTRYRSLHGAQVAAEVCEWQDRRARAKT